MYKRFLQWRLKNIINFHNILNLASQFMNENFFLLFVRLACLMVPPIKQTDFAKSFIHFVRTFFMVRGPEFSFQSPTHCVALHWRNSNMEFFFVSFNSYPHLETEFNWNQIGSSKMSPKMCSNNWTVYMFYTRLNSIKR